MKKFRGDLNEHSQLIVILIFVVSVIVGILDTFGFIRVESNWWIVPIVIFSLPSVFLLALSLVVLCGPKIRNYFRKRKLHSLKRKLGGNLRHANLRNAGLVGIDLQYRDIEGANLKGALLDSANLEGANLSETNLYGASIFKANLRGANMSGADLCNADLWQVDLREANLSRVNMSGADLCDANLCQADLRVANLSRAKLSGTDLKDTKNLTPTQLSQAILDETTIMPDGSHWQPPEVRGLMKVIKNGSPDEYALLIGLVPIVILDVLILLNLFGVLKNNELDGGEIFLAFQLFFILFFVSLLLADVTHKYYLEFTENVVKLKKQIIYIFDERKVNTLKQKMGGNLRNANLGKANLSNLNLRGIDIQGADLSEAVLSHADLVETNLANACLRSATMRYAALDKAKLKNADMRAVDLSSANLVGANLRGANLSYSNLKGANLMGADLSDANLKGANLGSANLQQSVMVGIDLRKCYLEGVDLSGADMTNAKVFLREANLIKATSMYKEKFNKVILDENTIMPDGSHWQPPIGEESDEEV